MRQLTTNTSAHRLFRQQPKDYSNLSTVAAVLRRDMNECRRRIIYAEIVACNSFPKIFLAKIADLAGYAIAFSARAHNKTNLSTYSCQVNS